MFNIDNNENEPTLDDLADMTKFFGWYPYDILNLTKTEILWWLDKMITFRNDH